MVATLAKIIAGERMNQKSVRCAGIEQDRERAIRKGVTGPGSRNAIGPAYFSAEGFRGRAEIHHTLPFAAGTCASLVRRLFCAAGECRSLGPRLVSEASAAFSLWTMGHASSLVLAAASTRLERGAVMRISVLLLWPRLPCGDANARARPP